MNGLSDVVCSVRQAKSGQGGSAVMKRALKGSWRVYYLCVKAKPDYQGYTFTNTVAFGTELIWHGGRHMPHWVYELSFVGSRCRNRSAIDAEASSHARLRPEISCFSLLSAMHAASPEPPDGRHTVAKGTQIASVCATTAMRLAAICGLLLAQARGSAPRLSPVAACYM
jgi:hypothetical protein